MQCLPTGRGTTVVTSDHDGVAIAAGDAAAVVAAAGLNLEAKEPELQCLPIHPPLPSALPPPSFSRWTGDATTMVGPWSTHLGTAPLPLEQWRSAPASA